MPDRAALEAAREKALDAAVEACVAEFGASAYRSPQSRDIFKVACKAYAAALAPVPGPGPRAPEGDGKIPSRERLIGLLYEAAGIRSDGDAWLMYLAADELKATAALVPEPSPEMVEQAIRKYCADRKNSVYGGLHVNGLVRFVLALWSPPSRAPQEEG